MTGTKITLVIPSLHKHLFVSFHKTKLSIPMKKVYVFMPHLKMNRKLLLKLSTFFVAFLFFSAVYADTLYVNHAAVGNNDGTSWSDAYTDLRYALSQSQYGDQLWVAQGIYCPTTSTIRVFSFPLVNGVQVYGGFTGTENNLNDRDWENNITVLSGDIGVKNDSSDNSYTVVYCAFGDSTTRLDGFTITGGNANDTSLNQTITDHTKSGGGMYIRGISPDNDIRPQIVHCVFTHNTSTGYGGAVYMESKANGAISAVFEHCLFSYNTASFYGGGIYKLGGSLKYNTYIYDCTFIENYSGIYGGAIHIVNNYGDVNNIIKQCLFSKNECFLVGGGVYYENFNSYETGLVIIQTTFQENTSHEITGEGAAIGFYNFSGTNISKIITKDCEFVQNQTALGAIFTFDSQCEISSCEFNYNIAINGACVHSSTGKINIDNSFFNDNLADQEGSIGKFEEGSIINVNRSTFVSNYDNHFLLEKGQINIIDCLAYSYKSIKENKGILRTENGAKANFTNCTVTNFKSTKGSLAYMDSYKDTINIHNCIIQENNSGTNKPMIWNYDAGPNKYAGVNISHSLFDVDSCTFIASSQVNCGPGNLYNLSPLFIDTAAGNYRLQPCSPARDAGSNTYLSPADSLDLDSNMRIIGGVVDMGAYEVAEYTTHIDSIVHVTCHGGCDGGAVLSTEHGCVPYTVVYGTEDSIFQNSPIVLSGLKAGSYDVGVTDAGGRTTSFAIVIEEPPLLEVSTDHTSVSCTDAIYGTATAAVQGGSPNYTLAWSSGDSTLVVDSLKAGSYILAVTDLAGCTALDSFTIEALGSDLDLFVSGSPITCHDAEDATIIATPFAGTAPFTWQWQGGQMTQILENIGAGSYAVTVSDALGCSDSLQIIVDNPAPLLAALSAPTIVCFDSANAVIVPTVSGGVPSYSFLWDNGLMDSLRMNVGAGDYQLILTDSNMCIDTQMVTIAENTTITLTDTIHHATGQTNADGAIVIQSPVGGIAPYSYMWNTGDTTLSLSNLLPGDYSLTVTDSLGCVQVFDYTVDFVIAVQELAGGDIAIKAYPNPVVVGGEIVLDIESRENATLQLQWVDVLGRVLMERKVNVLAGEVVYTIGVPEVAGVYWLVAGVGGEARVQWEWVVVR